MGQKSWPSNDIGSESSRNGYKTCVQLSTDPRIKFLIVQRRSGGETESAVLCGQPSTINVFGQQIPVGNKAMLGTAAFCSL